MGGRRTNVALLALLTVALLTGGLAFAFGTASTRLVLLVHGGVGTALVLLSPWKSVIARRGLRRVRRRPAPARAATSLLLATLILLTIASGYVAALVGGWPGPVTPMQAHVGAALVAVPLLLLHARRRRQRPRRTDLSRRTALRLGLLGGAAAATYVVIDGVSTALALPGADRRFTGSYDARAALPDAVPTTQWLSDTVPALDAGRWRLRVNAGGHSRDYTYPQLLAYADDLTATLDCTGGWYATQHWRGVGLDRLLPADVPGRSIEVISATGYRRRLPRSDAQRALLATAEGGVPLSAGHGAPLRLVVPGRRGFWWVKWVVAIELVDAPWWLQPPFPLQ